MSKLADVLSSIKEKETLVGTTLKDMQTERILHYKRISKLVQGAAHHHIALIPARGKPARFAR